MVGREVTINGPPFMVCKPIKSTVVCLWSKSGEIALLYWA